MSVFEFDVFISHASEDKRDFVEPLAVALRSYGLEVWFDKFTLEIGDNLRQSIERGLATSRFGIVIFSPAFFAKKWPQAELDALFVREMDGDKSKIILPVWHGITKEDLLQYSPILAGRFAGNSNEGVPVLAEKLVKVIRPDALILETRRGIAVEANKRLIEQLEKKYPGYSFGTVTGAEASSLRRPATPGLLGSQWRDGERIDIFVLPQQNLWVDSGSGRRPNV